jgi:hypothetical protein
MDYIMINSDDWNDAGKKYKLIKLERRPGSTATELTLEHDGKLIYRTVPYHNIEWSED